MFKINNANLNLIQEESLDNIAWLYAQFSLTFDTTELPLDDYFKNNKEQFDKFKEVEIFFSDTNLKQHFPEIELDELNLLLDDRIKQYQTIIINTDKTPVPFKAFYILFELFRQQNQLYGPGTSTHRNLWNIMSEEMIKRFCVGAKVESDADIIGSLKNMDIKRDFSKKAQKKEKLFFKLNDNFYKHLEGNSQTKPETWTVHHMIPSQTLTAFYKYYFELLSFKSMKIQETHKFDWFKIMEFNTQKSFLVQADTAWSAQDLIGKTATMPIMENRQADFVRAWYRWPPGLVFYGPNQKIRSDDPESEFEKQLIHIVGTSYYQKVEQLNNELLLFINKYERITTDKDREDISFEAMRLFKTIFTIHREYNHGKPVLIFPFYSKQWLTPEYSNDGKWLINTAFNADSVIYDSTLRQWIDMNDNSDDGPSIEMWKTKLEWREKSLIQQTDNNNRLMGIMNLDSIIPNLGILTLFSTVKYNYRHDELKRRKRNHFVEVTFYVDEILNKCDISNNVSVSKCDYYFENGSPLILAVPAWGWCKVFG
jgi:hypothetical protein